MEAKDTVMSLEELAVLKELYIKETGITRPDIAYVFAVIERQAENTWKARQPEIDEAYKAGRNEVVATIIELDEQTDIEPDTKVGKYISPEIANELDSAYLVISWKRLQAKLKEWGL